MTPLSNAVLDVSQMIDGTYPPNLDTEAHLWRRCMKVVEESGEATQAILGMLGENPRKGRTHERGDIRKELFDVALAALGAVAHLDGNTTDVGAMFESHALGVRDRLADALVTPVPVLDVNAIDVGAEAARYAAEVKEWSEGR